MKRKFLLAALLSVLIYAAPAALAKWTILVYMNCDNNLEPYGITDFLEMSSVGSDANINIVLQMDRAAGYSTTYDNWTTCKRFLITAGMTPNAANAISDLGEVDMGSPTTLSDFVKWGYANYPATNYFVVLWDHGNGWTKSATPPNGGLFKDFSNDDSSGKSISVCLGELKTALSSIYSYTGKKIELIGFDACLMQMYEVNEVCAPYANWYVGSEELEGADGWVYDNWLGPLAQANGSMTPEALGDKVASTYVASGQPTHSVVDLQQCSTFSALLNAFATGMMQARGGGYTSAINTLITNTTHFLQDYDPYGYYPPSHDYRDLGDFLDKVIASALPAYAKTPAQNLKNYFSTYVYSNYVKGLSYANCDGVAIYLPLSSNYGSYATDYEKLPIAATNWDEFLSGDSLTPPAASVNLSYVSCRIVDTTGGNGDGNLDGGETADIFVTIQNDESFNVTGISGVISEADTYVTVNSNSSAYPDLGTKVSTKKGESITGYNISVNRLCPAGRIINFTLEITTDQGPKDLTFSIQVDQMAPKLVNLVYYDHLLDDSAFGNGDGNTDATETIDITLTLKNTQIDNATSVKAILTTASAYATVKTALANFPDLAAGGSGASLTDYRVFISTTCPIGQQIVFDLDITATEGSWDDTFAITVDRPYEPVLSTGADAVFFPAWAHSGSPRKVAYIVYDAGISRIMTKNSDGTGIELIVANAGNLVSHVSQICWSPDDSHIVFAGGNPLRIYAASSDGSDLGASMLMQPTSGMAYYKWVDPHWTDALNMTGGDQRIVVSISGDIWSYVPFDTTYDSSLVRMTALSDPYSDLTQIQKCYQPVWSPDNTKIAFVRRPATRTNRVAKTDIYLLASIQDIIGGSAQPPTSLTDPRLILVDGADAPNYSPCFSGDGTVISYVKDIANAFNNFTFYTDPVGVLAVSNFDAYGNDVVLGTPPLNGSYNEGFLKWAPTGGDKFTFVKEETGYYELKVLCDPTIGGFKRDGHTGQYFFTDRSFTRLDISENENAAVLDCAITSPVSAPEMREAGKMPLGIFRNIVVNGINSYVFAEPAVLRIYYSENELPAGMTSADLGLYIFENNAWRLLPSWIEGDADGDPLNDELDGGFICAQVASAGLFGVFSVRTIDDSPCEAGDFIMWPNPSRGDVTIVAEDAASINIYTISGELAASLSTASIEKVHGNEYVWRLKNTSGCQVVPGIYLVSIVFPDGSHAYKKIAVIK